MPKSLKTMGIKQWLFILPAIFVVISFCHVNSVSAQTPAVILSPFPGATLPGTSVAFDWTDVSADYYYLRVGLSGQGSEDLYGGDQGTALSAVVSGLPYSGETVYVSLESHFGGQVYVRDYVYTACTAAGMLTPAPGSVLPGTSVIFEWSDVGADSYYLWIGTGPTSGDLYTGDQGTALSAAVGGLPYMGETVYVSVESYVGGDVYFTEFVYTACSSGPPADLMHPTPDFPLHGTSMTFEWMDAMADSYRLSVGTSGPGSTDIYNGGPVSDFAAVVSGLPHNGEAVYARLWSTFGPQQLYNDYILEACIAPVPPSVMLTPSPNSVLPGTSVTFEWSDAGADSYYLWVGVSGPASGDLYSGDQGTALSTVVGGLPYMGETVYVTVETYFGGQAYFNDYVYTACSSPQPPADLMHPAPDFPLYGTSMTFEWTGAMADSYRLFVGTLGPGSNDIYDGEYMPDFATIVGGLPHNGETVYARLWSVFGGQQFYNDYILEACTAPLPPAEMVTPASESVLPGTSVTLEWSDAGADYYYLHVGLSGPASGDLYSGNQGTALSAVIGGLPYTGETVYVSVESYFGGQVYINDYVYTACAPPAPPADLMHPAPDFPLYGTSMIFEWMDAFADSYRLCVGTSGPGSTDIHNSGQVPDFGAVVSGLPHNGETVYARLWSTFGTQKFYNDYTLEACTAPAPPAVMLTPVPGQDLPGTSVFFEWSNAGADSYYLHVGLSGPASGDLYSGDQGTALSAVVGGLPYSGETVYVSVESYFGGQVYINDYVYTACSLGPPADLMHPNTMPDFPLYGTSMVFEWTDASADSYALLVGTSGPGSADICSRWEMTDFSTLVSGLPHNGETVYVRLRSYFGAQTLYNDYVLTACSTITPPAEIITPNQGLSFSGTSVAFEWSDAGADYYYLYVGLWGPASGDLYSGNQGTALSTVVDGLPSNGETVYVSLETNIGGQSYYNDYVYTAFSGATLPAEMQNPGTGSILTSTTQDFSWNFSGADEYYLHIGTTGAGSHDIYKDSQGTNTSKTVYSLPNNGEMVYVRLFSLVGANWYYNDYMFTAYTGPSGPSAAEMQSPGSGTTLTSTTQDFTWNAAGADEYYIHVGKSGTGTHDIYRGSQGTNTSKTVYSLPNNGETVYVRLFSLLGGDWYYNDYTYTAFTGVSGSSVAEMQSPGFGSTLTSTTQDFSWNDSGAERYYLYVGTTGVGSYDIYRGNQGTNTSKTVYSLPNNGETVYVRLFSLLGGDWYYNDYTYTAFTGVSGPSAAVILNPESGSTLASTTQEFSWNNSGADSYYLYVGTTGVGSRDVYSASQGTNISATVTGLPNGGETVYVRLFSSLGGDWYYNDYTYTATGP